MVEEDEPDGGLVAFRNLLKGCDPGVDSVVGVERDRLKVDNAGRMREFREWEEEDRAAEALDSRTE